MKRILATVVAVFACSSFAHANPQSAYRFGTTLGQSFCQAAKRIYAGNVVIPPMFARATLIESDDDTLICKNAMADQVSMDRECVNLYRGYAAFMTNDMKMKIRSEYQKFQNYCNL